MDGYRKRWWNPPPSSDEPDWRHGRTRPARAAEPHFALNRSLMAMIVAICARLMWWMQQLYDCRHRDGGFLSAL
jgi:hypothetical protein